ncbi:hypothetical protein CYY_006126 [Polysphondylium violaceum]|uniref:Nucleosome assembly family protein n=1 Tax=Polysphondylium violaceum TaxID=133409 RepID=A0A8J4Q117_9MYCE|nr:hypothetical protein CYY_006126 [Polysphondylium violaceum]
MTKNNKQQSKAVGNQKQPQKVSKPQAQQNNTKKPVQQQPKAKVEEKTTKPSQNKQQQQQQQVKKAKVEEKVVKQEEKVENEQDATDESEIRDVQMMIDDLIDKKLQKVLDVDIDSEKDLAPLYIEREQVLAQIPLFWYNVVINHPILSQLITEKDNQLLKNLSSFKVESLDNSNVKFCFTFKPNNLIKNKIIWKEYLFKPEEIETNCSKIEWKNGNDITKNSTEPSFFSWFSPEDSDLSLFECFKEEIWRFPLDYYTPSE